MWKSATSNVPPPRVNTIANTHDDDDDWDTDPTFVNDVSEREQRFGSKTVANSGRTEEVIDIHALRSTTIHTHESKVRSEYEARGKFSFGYGGAHGVHNSDQSVGTSASPAAHESVPKYVPPTKTEVSAPASSLRSKFESLSMANENAARQEEEEARRRREEADRREQERLARQEQERLAREEADQQRQEAARQAEQERLAREQEADREAAAARQAEQAHQTAEADAERAEQERYAREQAEYQAEQERYAREQAEYEAQQAAYEAQQAEYEAQQAAAAAEAEAAAAAAEAEAAAAAAAAEAEAAAAAAAAAAEAATPAADGAAADEGTTAIALYDYAAADSDELTLYEGARLTQIEVVDENWWRGYCDGNYGMFPSNYVELQ
ncbi:hypothetical protein H696_04303 [Fonticula alba]|uniref:SH3 domain-containing protein n=1 Tax=Fonticula alba TaxID=691883 RepID=A0A058Z421_FONAL|nr:hypothetical protein H696_04303 [Fonticula alba]KCV68886.1 hypothetical protein H696_04303 [Fonticula alba]|eukprot:XP_009496457.1 hypothetical protein H696_04303 [Fonticula alba]